jgi:hypothetical protein
MDTYNPPELGRATGDHSRHHGKDKNNNAQQILDPAPNVNREVRELIRDAEPFYLFLIRGRRNRVRYEIVSGSKTWHFPLLFSAHSKLDRLTRNGAHNE